MNTYTYAHISAHLWLVISNPLKNISQLGWWFPKYGRTCSKHFQTTNWISCFVLVGGSATPLKNMTSSIGMMKFPIYGKIKLMFQTTNQCTCIHHTSRCFPTLISQCPRMPKRRLSQGRRLLRRLAAQVQFDDLLLVALRRGSGSSNKNPENSTKNSTTGACIRKKSHFTWANESHPNFHPFSRREQVIKKCHNSSPRSWNINRLMRP